MRKLLLLLNSRRGEDAFECGVRKFTKKGEKCIEIELQDGAKYPLLLSHKFEAKELNAGMSLMRALKCY